MRNFISYSEYLARHPDANIQAVTPVVRPVTQQAEPPAAPAQPATPAAPVEIVSAKRDSGSRARPYGDAFSPSSSTSLSVTQQQFAPMISAPSVGAGKVNAYETYSPEIESHGHRQKKSLRAQNSGGRSGAFAFAVMLMCFFIAVSCAFMLSNGLNLGHLKGTTTRYDGASHTAYCVQMAAPGTPEEAAQIARETRGKGGGGYIYVTDGLYLVLASAYDTEAACDDVIDTLMFSKVSASKFLIEIPAVSLDFTADKAAVAVIKRAYESFWTTYLALYNLSVDLDEGHIAVDPARLKLGEKNREISDLIAELTLAGASCTDMSYIHIKAALTALSGQLDTLFVDMDHASQLSADLKYAYLKLLHDFRALALELA